MKARRRAHALEHDALRIVEQPLTRRATERSGAPHERAAMLTFDIELGLEPIPATPKPLIEGNP